MDFDREACYRAFAARDRRFDGRFLIGVRSTSIFCRPICPARTPRLENCVFFPTAAAAYSAGFRPCLRCWPEISPGVAAWSGTAATVNRALRLLAAEGPEAVTLETLAARLGIGSRHLRRLFRRHVGASPVAVLQVQRIFLAKQLITDSDLPLTQVALGAGFGSIRRFNAVMQKTFGRPPSELRRSTRLTASALTLRLPYRPPYDWRGVLAFLGPRAIPGVESVDQGVYRRTIRLDGAQGIVEIRATPEDCLQATITVDRLPALAAISARLRHLFDLDADPEPITAHLARDPGLASRLSEHPGPRVPGAWDAFELAVRAILGQQVSVSAASTLAGRLAATFGDRLSAPYSRGDLGILFPEAKALAHADLSAIGISEARAAAISSLAAAVTRDPGLLRATGSVENVVARLTALPGIGEWTAHYIAMRALREPDAFPASDLGLLGALRGRLQRRADRWRPWRAYAAMLLWLDGAVVEAPSRPSGRRSLDAQSGPETAGTPPGAVPGFSPCHITGGSCSACPRPSTASPGGRGPALRSSSLRSSKSSRGDAVPRRSATR
jgi:AraC family transcriptional regulator of adaptative response / DNA-3-methyladenine glycosylase II